MRVPNAIKTPIRHMRVHWKGGREHFTPKGGLTHIHKKWVVTVNREETGWKHKMGRYAALMDAMNAAIDLQKGFPRYTCYVHYDHPKSFTSPF